MSTRHVILGLIRERPSHTYDVAVRFGKRLRPWQINRGQIYTMVNALAEDKLIEISDAPRESERSGPTWRLTPAGTAELERWFTTRTEDVVPMRGELLAKLAVAGPEDGRELLFALDWYERAIATQLAEDVQARNAPSAESDWSAQMTDRIADGAILHRDAELIWVRRLREFVQDWIEREGVAERGAELSVERRVETRRAHGR